MRKFPHGSDVVQVIIMIQKYLVHREEGHPEARFGAAYREYTKKVKRWL